MRGYFGAAADGSQAAACTLARWEMKKILRYLAAAANGSPAPACTQARMVLPRRHMEGKIPGATQAKWNYAVAAHGGQAAARTLARLNYAAGVGRLKGEKTIRYSRDGDYGGQTAGAMQVGPYLAAAADGSQVAACTQARVIHELLPVGGTPSSVL